MAATKYVVSIMDRYYLGDGFFLFNVNHTEIGTIDDETGIFKDKHGNEYLPMLQPEYLGSEVTSSYANIMDLRQLPEAVGIDSSLQEAVSEFDYLTKQGMYVVGRKSDGEVFCIRLNKEEFRQRAEEELGVKTEQPPNGFQSVEEIPDGGTGEIVFTPEEGEDIKFTPAAKDNEDIVGHEGDLKELQEQMFNGRFSVEELQDILEQLEDNDADITQCIKTIQKYIDDVEKGLTPQPPEKTNDKPKDAEDADMKIVKKPLEKKVAPAQPERQRINIDDLHSKITKTLIAQDLPARRVISELARKEMHNLKKRKAILLTGPTGVGKTQLMTLIAKYLNRPFIKIDATQITTAGYVGKDIEESLWELLVKCGKNVALAETAIVFFDEIDKKGSDKKSDVGGKGVINSLLPFIEGATYNATPNMQLKRTQIPIRTDNMIVIFGGAFSDVYKNLVINNRAGFGGEVHSKDKPVYRKATVQDFVEKGQMSDEFMGRVSIVKLNDLDVNDIKRIMLESDESALKIQEEIFEQLGTKIKFTDAFIDKVAENAHKRKSGARGLEDIIDESTWMAFDMVYCHPGEYEEVTIDEGAIEDPSCFQYVKKKGNQN